VGVLERPGEGWHGSGILGVAFIGSGEDTGGAAGKRMGRHQWRPVVGAFKMVVFDDRMTSGRGCDEADTSGRLAHVEEGGAVVAAAWPSAGGRRSGSGPRLGRKGEVGRLSYLDWKERWAGLDQKWAGRRWAGEG
jgi:hypothetical protein